MHAYMQLLHSIYGVLRGIREVGVFLKLERLEKPIFLSICKGHTRSSLTGSALRDHNKVMPLQLPVFTHFRAIIPLTLKPPGM